MRTVLVVLLAACLLTGGAAAQVPFEVGSPQAAFAGGPITLTPAAEARLRAQFHGDKVPLVPQPYRGRLDAALQIEDWPRVETTKAQLVAARGLLLALTWEQTRFLVTGGIWLAAEHARDLAGTEAPNAAGTAAMLWLYAVAASFTDGHKCTDPAAREAYLDRLRGAEFAPVLAIIRSLPDDQLTARRETAIKMEAALAASRTEDAMCRTASGRVEIRPDADWRRELGPTREMLPRHLTAITSVVRAKGAVKP
jgi:hypothetical protein